MYAANNKGADQTVQMRRLICAFIVHIWHNQVFSWCGSPSDCTVKFSICSSFYLYLWPIGQSFKTGPGNSVRCTFDWYSGGCGSILPSGNNLLYRLVMKLFYGHSHPVMDSSRAFISYRRKDIHLVLVNLFGLSLPRKSVVRLTDHFNVWNIKQQNT